MDLLNGSTEHGVWGSTHEGLQIRVKGNLKAEKWAPRPDLFTAGFEEREPEPFANVFEFKASLGPAFADYPLVVWGNPAAGGEVLHNRAYAQSILGLADELYSVLSMDVESMISSAEHTLRTEVIKRTRTLVKATGELVRVALEVSNPRVHFVYRMYAKAVDVFNHLRQGGLHPSRVRASISVKYLAIRVCER